MASRRAELFPQATDAEWRDWRWQLRHSVRSLADLARYLPLSEDERRGCAETQDVFRLGISPYYLSLIDPDHPCCPIRMQSIPVRAEARVHEGELRDPLGEDRHRPVRAIVHKYPDRVLLLALDHCSVYCRHCTRRRIASGDEGGISREELEEAVRYLRGHPEVRDVLISGGDPLLLSTERLVELLERIRAIPHVEIVRVGTRIPVCLPMRVDDELARALRRFAPLFVVTHFNHAKEITPEAREACDRLVDHGIPVENLAVPHLAVDLPGGGGKVTLQPDYVVEKRGRETVFRNYRGERYAYPEPEETDCSVPYDEIFYGVQPTKKPRLRVLP